MPAEPDQRPRAPAVPATGSAPPRWPARFGAWLRSAWRSAGAPAAPAMPIAAAAPAAVGPPPPSSLEALRARLQRSIEHRRCHPGYGFAVLAVGLDDVPAAGADAAELRQQAAQRIAQTLRPGDTMTALDRDDGDDTGSADFVAVLDGVRTAADACTVAGRLREVLAEPYPTGTPAQRAQVAVGIAGTDADSADAVLRDAGIALHEARRTGIVVALDGALRECIAGALQTAHDLRQTLAARRGDAPRGAGDAGALHVAYQPLVQLDGGALAGVEALVRWRHPRRGNVPPAQFLGVAEQAGLIGELGRFVLHEACRQFAQWQRTLGAAAPPFVAVNVAAAQLREEGFVAEVAAALRASGIGAPQLQLELAAAAADERADAALREVKALGVRVALDDFGSGHSSLASLHRLPLDAVKIDRSFVVHACDVEHHRVLVEATIRVARTLGITTVAEGIEAPHQQALMASLRCDCAQGYLLAKPMTAADFEAWARAAARAASDVVS